jgi:hypothetical protein
MNYLKLFFSKKTILRDLQIHEFKKEKMSGKCIEFGAHEDYKNNFLKKKSTISICHYSNFKSKSKKIIDINLEKNNNKKLNTRYDNVIIFNVLEHLNNIDIPLKNINNFLHKNGKIFGSTPFLYRIHGAPKDYFRFTRDSLFYNLKKNGFNKIKIKEISTGPFLTSYSLLRGYLKYLPFIYELFLLIALLLDGILMCVIKKKPNLLYPIGYVFTAKKK